MEWLQISMLCQGLAFDPSRRNGFRISKFGVFFCVPEYFFLISFPLAVDKENKRNIYLNSGVEFPNMTMRLSTEAELNLSPERRGMLHSFLSMLGLSENGFDSIMTIEREELKKAHRQKILEYHPDRRHQAYDGKDPDNLQAFLDIQQAYDALRDFIETRDRILAEGQKATHIEKPVAKDPLLIAVGGAKGGVGKSFLASSLAISLAASGLRVLAVDLDFGGANLHLLFGVRKLQKTVNAFFNKQSYDLLELLQPTPWRNLSLLGGDGTQLGIANMAYQQIVSLIRHLKTMPFDVVIGDLGAGTHFNTLDCFLMADERFVITTAEPTSVLDAYAMIKTSLYRQLSIRLRALKDRPARAARVENFLYSKPDRQDATGSIKSLIAALAPEAPALAGYLRDWIKAFKIHLVLNQSGKDEDLVLLACIQDLARKNLGVESINLRRVPYDRSVTETLTKLIPFVVEKPESDTALAIMDLAASYTSISQTTAREQIYNSLKKTHYQTLLRLRTQNFNDFEDAFDNYSNSSPAAETAH